MLASARAIGAVESRRWRCLPTARGALRASWPKFLSFRAPRPSEVPGSPFHRRSAPRGAPCEARISPSGSGLRPDRDTFAEFPGLFPAPSPRALALGFRARLGDGSRIYVRLAPARLHRLATRLRLAPRAPAKPRTTRQSEWWRLRRSLPSRLRAGSLTRASRAALRRSAEASGACIRQARIAFDSGSGRRAPADTRKEPK